MSEDEHARRGIDLDRPNAARVYDYMIGGELNGQMALMSGKLKLKGAMELAMVLGSVFQA